MSALGLSVALDVDLYSVVKYVIFEQKKPMLGIVGNKEIMKPLSPPCRSPQMPPTALEII